MAERYVGLTWDHPRGRLALEAAAPRLAADGIDLEWQVHSLEGFESAPIEQLAQRYDLIVLDHPHLGDALASRCLRPMEEVMGTAFLADVAERAVGPSLSSYRLQDQTWALPLDAATQVSACRADLVETAPVTWDDAISLSRRAPVALSLSGPHAYLTFASICQSLGSPLATGVADEVVDSETGATALAILAYLADRAPIGADTQNPIQLLERMTTGDDIAYIPLVYGYVGYGDLRRDRPVTFGAGPLGPDGGHGSTIGGTGIAVTRRAEVTEPLRRHLAWLLEDQTQSTFIPQHQGQPAMRAAWESDDVNAPYGDFYRRTRAAIDDAWIRPRFAGFTPVQSQMSQVVREGLSLRKPAQAVLAELTRIQNGVASKSTTEEIAS